MKKNPLPKQFEQLKKAAMLLKSNTITKEIDKLSKKHLKDFNFSLTNPIKMQTRVLKRILRENKNTLYGIKYGFAKIKNIEEYQKTVPIIEYKNLKEEINLIKKDFPRVLTKKKVVFMATTSGTTKTREPKTIPVTKHRETQFKIDFLLWGLYVMKNHMNILKGRTLYFAGPPDEGVTKGGIPVGSISGYHIKILPWYLKKKMVVPYNVYNILNFNKKTHLIAKRALRFKIGQICFATPIEAILFFDYLKENRSKLIKELADEGHKRTVKRLSKIDFIPSKIWPNLCLINCIVDSSNKIYLKTLKEKIGKNITIRDPGIYASEGRISLCLEKKGVAGVPTITYNFFEFKDIKTKQIFTTDKLKKNKSYEVIMTTQEGLYRYAIGDIVKVTGFRKKVPLIQFQDRNQFLNIAGELAHENVIVSAILRAATQTKIKLKGFTVIPHIKPKNKPRYEVLAESSDLKNDKIKKFLINIDKNLQQDISDYKQMRNEFGRLDAPVLTILKEGSYEEFNKKRIEAGRGQPKPIHIHKDEKFKKNFKIKKSIHP